MSPSMIVSKLVSHLDLMKGARVYPVDRCDLLLEQVSQLMKFSQGNIANSSLEFLDFVAMAEKHALSPEEIEEFYDDKNDTMTKVQAAVLKLHLLAAHGRMVGVTQVSKRDDRHLRADYMVVKVPAWTNETWEYLRPAMLKSIPSEGLVYSYKLRECHLFGVSQLDMPAQLAILSSMFKHMHEHVYHHPPS
jgi:hypothetical protein